MLFNTFQNSRAIVRTTTLKEGMISRSKCPIVILWTSQNERLSQVLLVAKETRLPLSLAIVTDKESVKDSALHRTKRAIFDVQLLFINGTETEFLYNSVRQNKAWNYARVAYV